jgi:hypothetical protein
MLGSVAQRLLAIAKRPVFVVPEHSKTPVGSDDAAAGSG